MLDEDVTIESSGNKTVNYTFYENAHTGKYKIVASTSSSSITKYFFVYQSKRGALASDYDYNVLYGDQFSEFNQADIEIFANDIVTSITDAYDQEVNQWGFQSPQDTDDDENLNIFSKLI